MVTFTENNSFQDLLKFIRLSHNTIFVISSGNILKKTGALDIVSKHFENNYYSFCDFSPNPKFEDVLKGTQLLSQFRGSAVLSVGGGSSIDMAKLISIAISDSERFKNIAIQGGKDFSPKLDLYHAPTTAGSGSEATNFAVLYINNKKYSIENHAWSNTPCCLDVNLIRSAPPYIAACSAIDALSQSIESIWSNNSNTESIVLASKAMKLILKNIEKALIEKNIKNQELMLHASHAAGKAINITKTTGAHALSYYLSQKTKIGHGHAVGIFLGKFFVAHCIDKKSNPILETKLQKIFSILQVNNGYEAREKIYSLMKKLDLKVKLDELKFPKKHYIDLVNEINAQRMNNNPIKYNRSDLLRIIEEF